MKCDETQRTKRQQTNLPVRITREVGVGLVAHLTGITVVVVFNHSVAMDFCPQASYYDVMDCDSHFRPGEVLTIAKY